MSYPEVINYILDQLPMYQRVGSEAYRASLDTSLKLDEYFDYPHKSFKTIHVGGTNGKGSVSHMLASVFQSAGYKTGLHTSPHLFDFRERIKVDGTMISEGDVTDFVNEHKPVIETWRPSFFELSVFMAFDYFRSQKVDVAIIEVGLGGRLDSTNVINPLLSVITNISFDHMHILGNTLPEIAKEKAGIIKQNTPVIIGERNFQTDKVFFQAAHEKNTPILFAQDVIQVDRSEYSDNCRIYDISKKYSNSTITGIRCDLPGEYQEKNIVTALATLEQIKADKHFAFNDGAIYKGLENVKKNTGLLGRWQVVQSNPLIVFDTAHNKAGLNEVVNQIKRIPHNKLHFIISMVNDKDLEHTLNVLPDLAHYYFTRSSVPRALSATELAEKAKMYSLRGEVYETPTKALISAKEAAHKDDIILISGSIFLVADLLKNF